MSIKLGSLTNLVLFKPTKLSFCIVGNYKSKLLSLTSITELRAALYITCTQATIKQRKRILQFRSILRLFLQLLFVASFRSWRSACSHSLIYASRDRYTPLVLPKGYINKIVKNIKKINTCKFNYY